LFLRRFCLLVGLLGLSACAMWLPPPNTPEPAPQTPTRNAEPAAVLSDAAVEALQRARDAVAAARNEKHLWLSAVQALNDAEQAASRRDSRGTIAASERVMDFCRRSREQSKLPPVAW
jgi:hypothetical protein